MHKTPDQWKGLGLELHAMISIQYIHHVQFNTMGSKLGCYIPLPFTTTLFVVLHKIEQNSTLEPPQCYAKLNKNGCANCNGILQLPSSLLRTIVLPLHLYLSYGRFRSIVTFLSTMCNGSVWNSPLGSTWITSQLITWLGSCTYFL